MKRRAVVKGGAAVGVAVWALPTILSVPASAAGSTTGPTTPPVDPPPGGNLIGNPSLEAGPIGYSAPSWTFS